MRTRVLREMRPNSFRRPVLLHCVIKAGPPKGLADLPGAGLLAPHRRVSEAVVPRIRFDHVRRTLKRDRKYMQPGIAGMSSRGDDPLRNVPEISKRRGRLSALFDGHDRNLK